MSVVERYRAVRADVESACLAAGRDPSGVGLIAVSKTHPLAAVEAVAACGQTAFGESYAQELRDKAEARPDLSWHFIGRIQSNKIRYIAPRAVRVHALERLDHAQALGQRAPQPLKCLVSVNLAGEASKGGIPKADALAACRSFAQVEGIRIVGLMTLPPPVDDPADAAPWFAQLAELAAQGRAQGLDLHELSMGMTHDFPVAIAHGATWVRIGTAIFGPRGAST